MFYIELIVVIAIIAILASMLLPALNQARERSRSIKCTSNLKQMGTALRGYAMDNKDTLPPYDAGSSTDTSWRYVKWHDFIYPYLGYAGERQQQISLTPDNSRPLPLFACPSQAEALSYHFGMNQYLGKVTGGSSSIGKVRHSSFRMLAMDRDNQVNNSKAYVNKDDAPSVLGRHNGNRNAVYLDGHVKTVRFAEVPRNREQSFWGYNAEAKGFTY
ncbi:MAG: DUF1559 domain-containing protein [Lentisphaeria bacterium]|nr:DUF1559 domain-containing protein [Lentisphaeria bacterium]